MLLYRSSMTYQKEILFIHPAIHLAESRLGQQFDEALFRILVATLGMDIFTALVIQNETTGFLLN